MASSNAQKRLSQLEQQVNAVSEPNHIASSLVKTDKIGSPSRVGISSSSNELNDMVVIVTGCDSPIGIGKASALRFAAHGCRALYMCDVSSEHLDQTVAKISANYPAVQVRARRLDCADEKAVEKLVNDVMKEQGRLDVFFANAGIAGGHKQVTEFRAEEFMDIIRVNTLSAFLAVKFGAPAMQVTGINGKTQSQGSIICTASVAGLRSGAGSTPYSCSKAGVISIVQTAAWQLGGHNIRCNAICPGLIETGMTAVTYQAARQRGTVGKIGQLNPSRRGGNPDEIARVAVFLASDQASYVNAQAIPVDGGLSGSHPVVPGKLS